MWAERLRLNPQKETPSISQESEEEMTQVQVETHDEYDPFADDSEIKSVAVQPYEDTNVGVMTAMDITALVNGDLYPQHLAMLDLLPYDEDKKEDLLSIYVGSEPRQLSEYFNDEILIRGSIFLYHPPYLSKENGEVQAGYHECLFYTDMKSEKGIPVILKCSSTSIAQHVLHIMRTKGWYLWRDADGKETPKKYRFSQAGAGKAYRMSSVVKVK